MTPELFSAALGHAIAAGLGFLGFGSIIVYVGLMLRLR